MSGAWRGQTGTDGDTGSRHASAVSACVSSGSGVGEESGAWCGVQGMAAGGRVGGQYQGTKKAEAPRGQLGQRGRGGAG